MARFVRDAVTARRGPTEAAPELLRRATQALAGRDVALTAAKLRELLHPHHLVESPVTEGSVNPREVRALAVGAPDV